jgi:hypothetical protein
MDDKFTMSYFMLLDSENVSDEVKLILKNKNFLENEKDLIIDLAKLLIIADRLYFKDGNIIAEKKVLKPLKINEDELIYKFLLKLKYNKLTQKDLVKIESFKEYPEYQELYLLLKNSLNKKHIFIYKSDDELKLTKQKLKELLDG